MSNLQKGNPKQKYESNANPKEAHEDASTRPNEFIYNELKDMFWGIGYFGIIFSLQVKERSKPY